MMVTVQAEQASKRLERNQSCRQRGQTRPSNGMDGVSVLAHLYYLFAHRFALVGRVLVQQTISTITHHPSIQT